MWNEWQKVIMFSNIGVVLLWNFPSIIGSSVTLTRRIIQVCNFQMTKACTHCVMVNFTSCEPINHDIIILSGVLTLHK